MKEIVSQHKKFGRKGGKTTARKYKGIAQKRSAQRGGLVTSLRHHGKHAEWAQSWWDKQTPQKKKAHMRRARLAQERNKQK